MKLLCKSFLKSALLGLLKTMPTWLNLLSDLSKKGLKKKKEYIPSKLIQYTMQSKKSDLEEVLSKKTLTDMSKIKMTQSSLLVSTKEIAKTQNMLLTYIQDLGYELDDLKIATGISRKKNIYFYKTSDKGH